MKPPLLYIFISIFLWSAPAKIFAQAPSLGAAGCFALFTITGAVSNTAASAIKGDVGTNTGAITGFIDVIGYVHNSDSTTYQSALDLLKAYNELYTMTPTATHIPVLGGGETLHAGVYNIAAAGSALTDLYLDGTGDSSALFVFKFGGAFTTASLTKVHLINGAKAKNIFWVAEGAISMGAGTIMRGNLLAHNGAVSMGAGGYVEGRMLSTTGAISVYETEIYNLSGCTQPALMALPIQLLSFTGACDGQNVLLKWSTASEVNNSYFTLERSIDALNWLQIERVQGAGNSVDILDYSSIDRSQNTETGYYRLKQTDFDDAFKYSATIGVGNCQKYGLENFHLYPNPSNGRINLTPNVEADAGYSIDIFNSAGGKVNGSTGFQSHFDLSADQPGIYFVQIHQLSGTTIQKIAIEK
jgi:Ice-binding-like/Secretion system C-terminal sorting domain